MSAGGDCNISGLCPGMAPDAGVARCAWAGRPHAPAISAAATAGQAFLIAGAQASKRLQHRLGAGDVELSGLLDVQRLDDTVLDQHRIALRTDAHAFLDAVELEPNRPHEVAAAVAEHDDLAGSTAFLAPGIHDKLVVDRDAGDGVDALGLEFVRMANVAGEMPLRAGPRISAGDAEQRHLLAAEKIVGGDRLDPVRAHIAQRHRWHLVANLDGHGSSSRMSVPSSQHSAAPASTDDAMSGDHSLDPRVYWTLADSLDDAAIRRLTTELSEEEARRARAFHFDRNRATYIAAHAMLRRMLREVLGGEEPDFVLSPLGRPELMPRRD